MPSRHPNETSGGKVDMNNAPQTNVNMYARLLRSVVRLTCTATSDQTAIPWQPPTSTTEGVGTGTIVGLTEECATIITNYHVIKGCIGSDIQVQYEGRYLQTKVYVAEINEQLDIAVLLIERTSETDNMESYSLPGDTNTNPVGEEILLFGFALAMSASLQAGIVTAREAHLFTVSAPMNGGNSGGPIILKRNNSDRLQLFGVAVAKLTGPGIDSVGMIIPATLINRFVTFHSSLPHENTGIGDRMPIFRSLPDIGISTRVRPTNASPQGVVICHSVHDPAHRGLILTHIDQKALTNDGKVVVNSVELPMSLMNYVYSQKMDHCYTICLSEYHHEGKVNRNRTISLKCNTPDTKEDRWSTATLPMSPFFCKQPYYNFDGMTFVALNETTHELLSHNMLCHAQTMVCLSSEEKKEGNVIVSYVHKPSPAQQAGIVVGLIVYQVVVNGRIKFINTVDDLQIEIKGGEESIQVFFRPCESGPIYSTSKSVVETYSAQMEKESELNRLYRVQRGPKKRSRVDDSEDRKEQKYAKEQKHKPERRENMSRRSRRRFL